MPKRFPDLDDLADGNKTDLMDFYTSLTSIKDNTFSDVSHYMNEVKQIYKDIKSSLIEHIYIRR